MAVCQVGEMHNYWVCLFNKMYNNYKGCLFNKIYDYRDYLFSKMHNYRVCLFNKMHIELALNRKE